MSVTRRTVVRGAAWSVPVVAIAAQAPAFAASPCLAVPEISNWTQVYRLANGTVGAGDFDGETGTNGFATNYGGATINRYLSEQDARKNLATASNATVTVSTTISGLTDGATYQLTFDLVSRWASDTALGATGQTQGVQATFGSTTLFSRQKRSGGVDLGYPNLTGGTALSGTKLNQTITVNYVASGTSAVFSYLFTLPGHGGNFASGSHDIAVSAPIFTSCVNP